MSRSTVKLLAVLVLVPSLFMGLMPNLVARTNLFNGLGEFSWVINGKTILELHRDVVGQPFASVWGGVWIIAILAEIVLLGVVFLKPVRKSRHIVTHRS